MVHICFSVIINTYTRFHFNFRYQIQWLFIALPNRFRVVDFGFGLHLFSWVGGWLVKVSSLPTSSNSSRERGRTKKEQRKMLHVVTMTLRGQQTSSRQQPATVDKRIDCECCSEGNDNIIYVTPSSSRYPHLAFDASNKENLVYSANFLDTLHT